MWSSLLQLLDIGGIIYWEFEKILWKCTLTMTQWYISSLLWYTGSTTWKFWQVGEAWFITNLRKWKHENPVDNRGQSTGSSGQWTTEESGRNSRIMLFVQLQLLLSMFFVYVLLFLKKWKKRCISYLFFKEFIQIKKKNWIS